MTLPGADAWLVDDRWSKAYPLGDETHIGRGVGSSIILRDPVISRRHASVRREADEYVLHSFGSAGTKVNGLQVSARHVLMEGDVIEIAFTSLRFTVMAPTGEMFIVTRDQPTLIDQQEGPTRATLRNIEVGQRSLWSQHPMLLVAVAIVVALIVFFAFPTSAR